MLTLKRVTNITTAMDKIKTFQNEIYIYVFEFMK